MANGSTGRGVEITPGCLIIERAPGRPWHRTRYETRPPLGKRCTSGPRDHNAVPGLHRISILLQVARPCDYLRAGQSECITLRGQVGSVGECRLVLFKFVPLIIDEFKQGSIQMPGMYESKFAITKGSCPANKRVTLRFQLRHGGTGIIDVEAD